MYEALSQGWFLAAAAGVVVALLALRRRGRTPALTPAGLADLRRRGVLVLGVRTPEEFRQGHLPGSRNLPLDSLDSNLAGLERDRPILTVCASGMRSAIACRRLARAGFREVRNAGPWHRLEASFRDGSGTEG
jgi:rhodanese-related sulfurtransferase